MQISIRTEPNTFDVQIAIYQPTNTFHTINLSPCYELWEWFQLTKHMWNNNIYMHINDDNKFCLLRLSTQISWAMEVNCMKLDENDDLWALLTPQTDILP